MALESPPGVEAGSYADAPRRDDELLIHSWVPQGSYEPEFVTHAAGNYFWTGDGRRILDFRSQAFNTNIGHGDHRIVDAIHRQYARSGGIYSYATEPKLRLAERILDLLPDVYGRVYFGQNGTDSVELALKVARMITGRQNIIAFHESYHGASVATASISGEPRSRLGAGEPVPGTVFVPAPYHYRCAFGGSTRKRPSSGRSTSFPRRSTASEFKPWRPWSPSRT